VACPEITKVLSSHRQNAQCCMSLCTECDSKLAKLHFQNLQIVMAHFLLNIPIFLFLP